MKHIFFYWWNFAELGHMINVFGNLYELNMFISVNAFIWSFSHFPLKMKNFKALRPFQYL